MKFTSQQYAQALFDSISETAAKDHDIVLDNFVKILAANGDLGKHPEIETAYHRLEMESKGIKQAEVTFAQEHNPKILDELNNIALSSVGPATQLRQGFVGQAGGPKPGIEFSTKLDEKIIGGVVVRVDDTLIDASIRTQLDNLNSELKS